ncbi:ATP-binding protein [Adlercreutzia shanghongiae]|uniref:ATP-binding protein n=1 Tax=Adlercreutzia shanghongiae TaxID=3111773 RepID=A0ABU6IZM9_9ACTN|nr:ATP-binding protein [Adlercreutzia sp. R22]MEC4295126.1 ATP-binding protein [Adlercreutzia sp. R22]
MINRPDYLEKLRRWKDRDVIKVVTGVRRCGKSTLLRMYADSLIAQGVPENRIITLNLEQLENESFLDYHLLHDEIISRLTSEAMHYVFIDEVQNVPDFQKAIDSLYTRPNIDLYITGSNAMLLGGTLATLLSGRYVEVAMTPLSFAEYASATEPGTFSLARIYSRYISQGSFPATTGFAQDSLALHDYLEGILNTVLLKDVAQRLNIANTLGLGALVDFMFDNIGNLTSIKRIADTLTAQGSKISHNTVAEYLSALCNSYILYPAKCYDVRGKRLLKLQGKYYAVDMGMRRVLLSNQVRDTGRILENVVFLELMRRNGSVFVGRWENLEVDFVVQGPQGPSYFQVAESVRDEATLSREIAPLAKIADNYPKCLLTLDDTDPVDHGGIRQINALDWLLS